MTSIYMTISTEIGTPFMSSQTESSDFPVFRGTNSNVECGPIWICAEEYELFILADFFGGGIFSWNCHVDLTSLLMISNV